MRMLLALDNFGLNIISLQPLRSSNCTTISGSQNAISPTYCTYLRFFMQAVCVEKYPFLSMRPFTYTATFHFSHSKWTHGYWAADRLSMVLISVCFSLFAPSRHKG